MKAVNPRDWEAEIGGSLRFPGQPELHSETLYGKNKQTNVFWCTLWLRHTAAVWTPGGKVDFLKFVLIFFGSDTFSGCLQIEMVFISHKASSSSCRFA